MLNIRLIMKHIDCIFFCLFSQYQRIFQLSILEFFMIAGQEDFRYGVTSIFVFQNFRTGVVGIFRESRRAVEP